MVPYEINQILHHNISDLTILKSRLTIYRNYPINISSQVGSLLITCNANMLSAKSLQLCWTQCDPLDCSLLGSSVHGDSPGKNTGENCHALLQGNLPNPGIELMSLLPMQESSLPRAPPEKPNHMTWSWTNSPIYYKMHERVSFAVGKGILQDWGQREEVRSFKLWFCYDVSVRPY